MKYPSIELPGRCACLDRRGFLISATALLAGSWHSRMADAFAAQAFSGCFSAQASGQGANCYASPAFSLRSLQSVVPDRRRRKNVELTSKAILDVAEQAIGFRPLIQIYNDLSGPPNATAVYDFEGPGQSGRLLIGYRMLGDIVFATDSDLLYAGIMLHEVGHLYQMRSGLCQGLICGDRVIGAELHADFVAGLLLGRAAISMPAAPAEAMVNGWTKMGDKADAFNRCDAHGTAQQRLFHLHEGLRLGANMNDPFDDLAQAGARAIMNDNPCHQGTCR